MVTPEFKAIFWNVLTSFPNFRSCGVKIERFQLRWPVPFRNEKTASFSVNSSRQFYYCFGCGAKGDSIQFLMDYFNLSFVDALKELCQKAGLHFQKIKVSLTPLQSQKTKTSSI